MLTRLEIQNFALIESLELDWKSGLTVITGETGSGKSIMLGALGLILGQRANLQAATGKKCVVEGYFNLSDRFQGFFDDENLDFDRQTIIRREILPGGKSRAFVNDTPATLEQLRNIADRLIDIHSQDDTRLLTQASFQLELIDLYGGHSSAVENYQKSYALWLAAQESLRLFREQLGGAEDENYLQYLVDELETIKPVENEYEKLEEEWKALDNVTEIRRGIGVLIDLLDADDYGMLERLRLAVSEMDKLRRIHQASGELHDRLQSTYIELKDISDEAFSLSEQIQDDPQRLIELETRMSALNTLAQKHHCASVDELPGVLIRLQQKLDDISGFTEKENALKKQLADCEAQMLKAAMVLRNARLKTVPELEKDILQTLHLLNFSGVGFSIQLEEKDCGADGADRSIMLFSANKGQPLRPIQKVASGGEKSRIMLAIKAALAKTKSLPTLIFDEIDTGIGGETAAKVAQLLRAISGDVQLVAITHLPQIAAAGQCHWRVYKEVDNDTTHTNIKALSDKERTDELARMLSGDTTSEAARENARVLLGLD